MRPLEVWRQCTYPLCGKYEVSTRGRVRHRVRKKERKPYLSTNGYLYVSVALQKPWHKNTKRIALHRMVCHTFNGPAPSDKHTDVNHENGIKTDNRPWNLEWCTRPENMRHALEEGLLTPRGAPGGSNGNAKLTADDVNEIRRLFYKEGVGRPELAMRFNIKKAQCAAIVRGAVWKHVPSIALCVSKPYQRKAI